VELRALGRGETPSAQRGGDGLGRPRRAALVLVRVSAVERLFQETQRWQDVNHLDP
jgi:hypothetical protein